MFKKKTTNFVPRIMVHFVQIQPFSHAYLPPTPRYTFAIDAADGTLVHW